MNKLDVLNRPFDIETHMKTFINYCEVIILKNGIITYAIPSHHEKLIKLYCDKYSITRKEFDAIYKDNFNWLDEILEDLECVLLWYDNILYKSLNKKQLETISLLIEFNITSDEILSMLSY